MFTLRSQLELWLVAALAAPKEFAAFSLAGVGVLILSLLRGTVTNVVFPKMNGLLANGDNEKVAQLNSKATTVVASLLFPVAVFLWVFADQVVTVVFTEQYISAANVMRVCLLAVIPQIFEGSALLRMCGLGRTCVIIDAVMLPIVVGISFLGFQSFGLPAAAAGSVMALFVGNAWAVWKGGRALGISIKQLYDFGLLLKLMLSALLTGFIAWYGLLLFSIDNNFIHAALGGVIFFISYLSISLIAHIIPQSLLDMFHKGVRKFAAKVG